MGLDERVEPENVLDSPGNSGLWCLIRAPRPPARPDTHQGAPQRISWSSPVWVSGTGALGAWIHSPGPMPGVGPILCYSSDELKAPLFSPILLRCDLSDHENDSWRR